MATTYNRPTQDWTASTINVTPINEKSFSVDDQQWILTHSVSTGADEYDYIGYTFRNMDEGIEYTAGKLVCDERFICLHDDISRTCYIENEPVISALFACVRMFKMTY